MLNFVIWDSQDIEYASVLMAIQGVENVWELNEGISRIDRFPSDANFHMDPGRPDDTIIPDNVQNINGLVVVSLRVCEFMKRYNLPFVEYLPCNIVDHKGKTLRSPYFIVHATQPVDLLDPEGCGAIWNRLRPEFINRVRRLAIREHWLDKATGELVIERGIFRDKAYRALTFVRRDLANALIREDFTGLRWKEIEDYPRPGAGRG